MKTVIQPKWTPKRLPPPALVGWYKVSPLSVQQNPVINGQFTADVSWTKGTGCTIPGDGTCKWDGTQAGGSTTFQTILTIGNTYTITYTVNSISVSWVRLTAGNASFGALRTTPGTYTETLTCAGSSNFGAQANTGTICSISNVSISPIAIPYMTLRATSLLNGSFATDVSWIKGTGWSIPANGTAVYDGSQGVNSNISQNGVQVVGDTYKLTYTINSIGTGTMTPQLGTLALTTRSAAGTYTETAISAGSAWLYFIASANCACTISNVTLQPMHVSQLYDMSGNGHHLLQAVAANQPIYQPTSGPNSNPTIHANGTAHFLKTAAFTLNQPAMQVGVLSAVTNSGNKYILDGNTVNSFALVRSSSSTKIAIYSGVLLNYNPQPNFSQFYVYEALYNSTNSAVALNGAARTTGDAGTNNPGGLTFGRGGSGSAYIEAYISELIIMNRDFTNSERASLIAYLNQTWGVY